MSDTLYSKTNIPMPFKKKGDKYESPSGKMFTEPQVKAYYATDGFKKKMTPGLKRKLKNKMKRKS